ncbi:MAG: metal ABC transporter permease, partial [Curtobacterium sp.]
QIVGALLVLSLLVTPAAAALRLSSHPVVVPVLSTVFAVTSVVGGILLALGGGLPISPYVTTISFAIWVVCRIVGSRKDKRGRDRVARRERRDGGDPGLQAGGAGAAAKIGVSA